MSKSKPLDDEAPPQEPPRPKPEPKPKGTPGRKPAATKLAALQADLVQMFVEAGAALSLVGPVTGIVWAERAPKRARALVKLADRNPALRRALERMVSGSVAFDLAIDAIAIGVAVGVDLGRIEGDGLIADRLGVGDVYRAIEEEEGRDEEPDYTPPRSGVLGGIQIAPS